jgi:hypothetical protein
VFALTLETALNTFAVACITGAAVATVSAVIGLLRRMRAVDKTVTRLTRWARRVGSQVDVPYDDDDEG